MPRTCIYCRQRAGPFGSEEHVVPESLGNHDLILPPGVVCNPCNNGALSRLDELLVQWEPIKMLRALRGVPGKKGRQKSFRLPGLAVRRNKRGGITVRYEVPENMPTGAPAPIEFTGTQRMDEHFAGALARALLKQMLGGMYFDFGRKFVLQSRFDGLRATILGCEPYGGVLAVGRHLDTDAFGRGRDGFTYNFVGEGGHTPPMWVEGRFLGLSLGATWGARVHDLDRAHIPGPLADRFNLIEVDPTFGVR